MTAVVRLSGPDVLAHAEALADLLSDTVHGGASIGFLAPSHEQLVHNFLGFLGEEAGSPKGIYADPDLTPQEQQAWRHDP